MAAPTSDLRLVPARRLVTSPVDAVFRLSAGDRPLVAAGDLVVVGAPLAERVHEPRLEEHAVPLSVEPVPGARWTGSDRRGGAKGPSGEYVFEWRGRWRIATGEAGDLLETPFAGIVREVRPGIGITSPAGRGTGGSWPSVALRADASRPAWTVSCGQAASMSGRPARYWWSGPGSMPRHSRVSAMGIRGIVVAGLSSKERRDYLASEARQRSALHKLPPFAVLILDGAARRPLGGAVLSVLGALTGREVAIIADPPMLVFDHPDLVVPDPPADLVRIRSGTTRSG